MNLLFRDTAMFCDPGERADEELATTQRARERGLSVRDSHDIARQHACSDDDRSSSPDHLPGIERSEQLESLVGITTVRNQGSRGYSSFPLACVSISAYG